MEALGVIQQDIRINATVVSIMVSLVIEIYRSSKKEVKTKPNCATNEDKKGKAKALEPALRSDQHSNPKLSPLASNSCHENPNLGDKETPRANPTAHEVCIDGWTFTYKEFQPRRINQGRKKANQPKINHQSQQLITHQATF